MDDPVRTLAEIDASPDVGSCSASRVRLRAALAPLAQLPAYDSAMASLLDSLA
jgi:hypothetical protein